ncbi:MAG TPA: RibD family protein [Verrucomicrobiae bacterium]|jgi:riboflavin-specific deaminase-like protein
MSFPAKIRRPKLPFVFINMAMTADAKIATANRAVHSFGSARDSENFYRLRATADAIICGARTVEISRAVLDNGPKKFNQLRLKNGLTEYNIRILVSGSGSIDSHAEIFRKPFSPIIILTTGRISKIDLKTLQSVATEVKICGQSEINFPTALRWLHKKWGVRRLLCEGGGELNEAFFRADLVDEIHLTICPKIFGGQPAPTIAEGSGFPTLAQAARFKLATKYQKAGELFTVFSRVNPAWPRPFLRHH